MILSKRGFGELVKLSVKEYFYICIILLVCSCANVPVNRTLAPLWTADVNAAYPDETYIARKSYGSNKQGAQISALAALSKFFLSQITVSDLEQVRVTDAGSQSTLTAENMVRSQIDLFAVRYTEPWYNDGTGQWEAVAYIDRNEAWGIFEPNLTQKTNMFNAVYDEAERQNEPLRRILLYTKAAGIARREDILTLLQFAAYLNPAGVLLFDDTRYRLSQIAANIEKLKSSCGIFIADAGIDPLISTAFAESLARGYFPIEKSEGNAAYICTIAIVENQQTQSAGTFYYPSVEAIISGKNGAVFAYTLSLNRVGASTPEAARRRVYTAITNEIKKNFFEELMAE
jgi:hypothetical protein